MMALGFIAFALVRAEVKSVVSNGVGPANHLAAARLEGVAHGLQRSLAIDSVRRDHVPASPVGLPNVWRNSLLRHHAGIGYEHERMFIAGHSRQLGEIRARHHKEFVFLLRQRTHGERTVPVEGTHQYVDAILFDELRCDFDSNVRIQRIVCFKNDDRAPQHAATLVIQIYRNVCAMHVMDRRCLIGTRQRIENPNLDRLVCLGWSRSVGKSEYLIGQVAEGQRATGCYSKLEETSP